MRGGNLVRIGLESARFDIDGNKLAGILCGEVRLLSTGRQISPLSLR